MKIGEGCDGDIFVTLTVRERNIITNCLGYLCHAQTPPGFTSIANATPKEVEDILNTLLSVL